MTSPLRRALWLLQILVLAAGCLTALADDALAAKKKRAPVGDVLPKKYAAIVVDAATGRVLEETSAKALRHPASLTKIMTLYVVFAQVTSGKLDMNESLRVSSRAANMPPSKLGLRAGQSIRVRDAIMGLVTESANDAAAVLAEGVAGSESAFATLMTKTARKLGMARTVFKNASGLPDPRQVTTARDMAILARALINHFPDEYQLFSTVSFNYQGNNHINHNRLMQRYEGMDGIKTGYIRASGFNLVASAVRDDRRIIAVVFGGTSASRRDSRMTQILDRNFTRLKDLPETEIAEAPQAKPAKRAAVAHLPQDNGIANLIVSTAHAAPLTPQQVAEEEGRYRHPRPVTGSGMQAAAARSTPPTLDLKNATIERGLIGQQGWTVQVGAYRDQVSGIEAVKKTAAAVARMSGRKIDFEVQPVVTPAGAVYSGRLKGLDAASAQAVCRALTEKGQPCQAISSN